MSTVSGTEIETETLITQSPYVPETSTSAGTKGQEAWDADFRYLCIEDNLWSKVSHSIEW